MITDKNLQHNNNLTGSKNVNIYQQKSGRLILQAITSINLNSTLLNFFDDLASFDFNFALVSHDGIFVFVDRLNSDNIPKCHSKVFQPGISSFLIVEMHPETKTNESNKSTSKKNKIISKLLTSEYETINVKNEINLTLSTTKNYTSIAKEIHSLRKNNILANKIIIKPHRAGVQMSELQFPISAYDRSLKYKDENELFYSTIFRASKSPKLMPPNQFHHIELGLKADHKFVNIGSKYKVTESLSSDIGLSYSDAKLNISRLHMGFQQFSGKRSLNSYQLGRFSPLNSGFLFNTNKLNKNEGLINGSAYLNLQTNCRDCILNALAIGYEQYSTKIDGYTRLNLLLHNFKQRSETTFELSIRKHLNKNNRLILSSKYALDTKKLNVTAKLVFPLNSIQGKGTISYTPIEKELISNWVYETSSALIENTPSFLKRNWKNYINFNRP